MPGIASRHPSRDKARPFLARASAEGWTASMLAKEAGIGRTLAAQLLADCSRRADRSTESKLSGEVNRAVMVARRVRDAQIEQAERIESLTEKALAVMEEKAKRKELSVRDLGDLVKLRERHWLHLKDLSGVAMAEKLMIAQAKGDATGRGIAGALLDATTIDIGAGVWESADVESDDRP